MPSNNGSGKSGQYLGDPAHKETSAESLVRNRTVATSRHPIPMTRASA